MSTEDFPQCTVTVQATNAQGQPLPGAAITALLNRTHVYGAARLPKRIDGQTDAQGLCELRLFQNGAGESPSQYKIRITHPDVRARTLVIFIPAGTQTANAMDLVVGEPPAAPAARVTLQALLAASAPQAQAASAGLQTLGLAIGGGGSSGGASLVPTTTLPEPPARGRARKRALAEAAQASLGRDDGPLAWVASQQAGEPALIHVPGGRSAMADTSAPVLPDPLTLRRRAKLPPATPELAALLRETQIVARNAVNLAKSAYPKGAVNSITQLNTCRYNLMLGYGQSYMQANHAWPALSKNSHHGNLMLGDCVRPESLTDPVFTPIGGATFRPLVERVQNAFDDALLSDEQVAAMALKSGSRGESVLSGALNSLKRLHNDQLLVAHDASRLFVAGNAAVGSRSIEELSKGAEPNLYARCTDFIQLAKRAADAEGASCAVSAVFWMQGENNYRRLQGGTQDKDAYKAMLAQLRRDLNADAAALCGSDQHRPPAFFSYQSGATWTRDSTLMSIGMAQWEFTRETPGCYLVGPTYAYTDTGNHLDANGTRWFGNQIGKVAHRVLTLRQDWRPLAPTALIAQGNEIEIDFHVPEPPLQWRRPYVQTTATDFPNKGFRVSDQEGDLVVQRVQIVADTIVRLTLDRAPGKQAFVWYASKETEGRGCLCDSDPAVAHDAYSYTPGSGQNEATNIPELVGQPYPLQNWCLAFRLPVPWRL